MMDVEFEFNNNNKSEKEVYDAFLACLPKKLKGSFFFQDNKIIFILINIESVNVSTEIVYAEVEETIKTSIKNAEEILRF